MNKSDAEGRIVNRSTRMELANQTVEIVGHGFYTSAGGRVVNFAEQVRACLVATRFLPPQELERLRKEVLSRPGGQFRTTFEVLNETTLAGIARVLSAGQGPVAALNFASAKNPGGGFLKGSQAQEESLARSSALYASLLRAREYYDFHRASKSALYSDAMILSPGCPIIRDDAGRLLDQPRLATFITSAAPNAAATAVNRPEELVEIPKVFHRRAEYVLGLAASEGYRQLVLGAWGCGVFGNDPTLVAGTFSAHLRTGAWAGRFERVVFSVLDTSPAQRTLLAFQRAFGETPKSARILQAPKRKGMSTQPAGAGQQQSKPSLYERLGGIFAIATVVDDFIDRVMHDARLNANPAVNEAHHRVPPAGFKYLVTEMVGMATGGPQKYTGRSMPDSHRQLNITPKEWDAFMDDFQQSLDKFQVPAAEQAELKAIVQSTYGDIVFGKA